MLSWSSRLSSARLHGTVLSLIVVLTTIITMMHSTMALVTAGTGNARVAVLGSGVAGSTAARRLAEAGLDVTVFEAGFGLGGRTSTRVTRDKFRYGFDHGAQYVGGPKTASFREALEDWRDRGWVQAWTGRFVTAGAEIVVEQDQKERYVGVPGMHSVCRHLLHHENIKVVLQTRANANTTQHQDGWRLTQDKTNKELGTFDWLVSSDRLSAAHYRRDIRSTNNDELREFRTTLQQVENVKSLTAMVVLETPLSAAVADGTTFTDPALYGSLGWAARDSSKPGRARRDGKECWVLQSHPQAAAELLKLWKQEQKGRFTTDMIRDKAREVLVRDFAAAVPRLTGEATDVLPTVVHAVGHRWGAAFPLVASDELRDTASRLLPSQHFVACGDYFGKASGRVEGAYLSGASAAEQLLSCLNQETKISNEKTP